MLGLPLAFSAPLVLAALALLPALYWLLRLTPPRPRQIAFPPLKLILDLKPKEETPARTPWWLLAMRLALAALIVLAMAGPIWNPPPQGEGGRGPLLVILDDGWPAATEWDRRVSAAAQAIQAAAREGRAGALLAVSEGGREIVAADPQRTVERLRALKPAPYSPDRMASLPAIKTWLARNAGARILWIADGLDAGQARPFAQALRDLPDLGARPTVLAGERTPAAIVAADNAPGALELLLRRADDKATGAGRLRAYDLKGLLIGDAPFSFAGALEARARFELPIELRNEIARVEIDGERAAGAVTLLDSRWKRRRIAIVSGVTADTAQPLLAPSFYLAKALAPFADVREPRAGSRGDPVLVALEDRPAVLALADIGAFSREARAALDKYLEEGGVLLRFAGPRLASAADDLTPVRLRRGGRVLGGSLSWDQPRRLAPFERESPFAGLTPPSEVTVVRQVLAEPEAGLPGKTWAALDDGTPLVTAARRGKGMIVLFHITADTTWSNLPLSGLFVDMLRRVVALAGESAARPDDTAQGTTNAAADRKPVETATIAPTRTLDGFGALGEPPVTARPIPVNYAEGPRAEHPPGFYGPPEALTALNPLSANDRIARADLSGLDLDMQALQPGEPIDLRPWLITLALLLFLADALASMWLAGGLRQLRAQGRGKGALAKGAAGALALLALAALAPIGEARAQTPSPRAAPTRPATPAPSSRDIAATLQTRLAYVVSGDQAVDEASRLGLQAVSEALANRTALSPGEPVGVDPARDDLTFFPLLYWPIVAGRPQPSAEAVTRISAFMKQGGTIVFDTRDALRNRPGDAPTPETAWLRQLLAGVDVPELEPVPRDHVLTKTFYLLDSIVGRYTIGQTWVEALPPATDDRVQRPARAGDSVSPIIITSNDLAAAWATDGRGAPLYPLTPGLPRQREFALRSGVNLVMYTLTGNYKADQVHARDILERLGH